MTLQVATTDPTADLTSDLLCPGATRPPSRSPAGCEPGVGRCLAAPPAGEAAARLILKWSVGAADTTREESGGGADGVRGRGWRVWQLLPTVQQQGQLPFSAKREASAWAADLVSFNEMPPPSLSPVYQPVAWFPAGRSASQVAWTADWPEKKRLRCCSHLSIYDQCHGGGWRRGVHFHSWRPAASSDTLTAGKGHQNIAARSGEITLMRRR